ncbi:FDX-ACB-domain-containing protein [Trichoderma longibrachiatum ATCC 18648]|uniref:FDX-ACB-domain-containing protein n=1 Tax=Trichoderma longibrachiatum ATCC 18648 TaxID=983965 RepID=A0A2T4BV98_TRILO|nr:FDX-ACB-domain-containing protein [Trichoderma longibrachiatum ATCC 18648]
MASMGMGSMRCLGASLRARQLSLSSRALRQGFACRSYSAATSPKPEKSASTVTIRGETHPVEKPWFNVPKNIVSKTSRRLHLQPDHPISITRQIIQANFPEPTYKYYNEYSPVVTTHQNFDSLGFPKDHPGRALTDTYYLNEKLLLRTHTSAHQAETFRANESDGYLISADVYRRDAIDRSHYPIFHQMEGARSWDRNKVPNGDVAAALAWVFDKAVLHENDVMELVRSVGGDEVESVSLIDEFVHPKTGRKSLAYRIVYRSLERTLTGHETNNLHERVRQALVTKLGVELR